MEGTKEEGEAGCGQAWGGFGRDSRSGFLTMREAGERECFEKGEWYIPVVYYQVLSIVRHEMSKTPCL